MFETAELGRKVPKAEYKKQVPLLREELLAIQQDLRKADFPVILVFAGVDGAGKGEIVNLLSEWMDPRWLVTHAYTEPSQEEAERPEYWRYWRDLPPKGRIGIFLSSWYSTPVLDRVNNRISMPEFDEKLDRIIAFEKALADDGALILKFWMHLGKSEQKKRLKSLEKDPEKNGGSPRPTGITGDFTMTLSPAPNRPSCVPVQDRPLGTSLKEAIFATAVWRWPGPFSTASKRTCRKERR